ncbi:Protein kinase superfamily protein [Raphanus sativus]|uniref:Mitogen-activated protein kinase kinase kinase 20-like n=1 Tax=Raphanus sativus TaxID=3726 RepID=A0A6J0JRH3_RAPSA|nr:mitogen-activated protein kinase kinase kinase 20-like [Raphanus sativus]KAJ4891385.1 Protein kinase superfamily protein [Raphanus sativus]
MAIKRVQRCCDKPFMKFVKFLGKGSYGSVDLYRHTKPDGSTSFTAAKVSSDRRTIEREFRVLSQLKGSPRIVRVFSPSLHEGFDNSLGSRVYEMPMEYASAGNLSTFIRANKRLNDSTVRDFTRMILEGLVSVHSLGYVHCDLKPDNLLLFPVYDQQTWTYVYDLKIADFGLALKEGEEVSDNWSYHSPFVGTPMYMSPESVEHGTVGKALDLWSLGCVVLEMFTGKRPWSEFRSLYDLEDVLVEDKKVPEIPDTVPSDARQFLDKCFALTPEDRGTASELLLHPFLAGDDKKTVDETIMKPQAELADSVTTTKKALRLKIVSSKLPLFKRVSNKPLKLKILPPVSTFVPVQ